MKFKAAYIILVLLIVLVTSNLGIAQEKVRIGVSTALTGDASTYGIDIKNALLFANEVLADNKYELVFEDDKCSGKEAVNIAHKFIDVLHINYVAGFACSSTVFSSAPLYERSKTLVMISSASAAAIANAGEYVFRTFGNDDAAAATLFNFVARKYKKFGVISEQTDYAQGFLNSLVKNNSAGEIEIINDNYLSSDTDFRTQLLRLKGSKVEGLFINSQSERSLLNVLTQVKELKWNIPIYSAYYASSATFLEKAGAMSEGIINVDLPKATEILNAQGTQLLKDFRSKYGSPNSWDIVTIASIEGFRALHQAIQSGQDTRSYLYATTFHGMFGDWSFDKNGEIRGLKYVVYVIRDKKSIPID